MDCTGSMSSWMTEAKTTLLTLIDEIKKKFRGYNFRVAFVGYRDFDDKELRFAVKDFTDNLIEIRNFIGQ